MAIEIRDVCFSYRSGDRTITALDGLSMSIASGSLVGVTGPNGSGKSSLAKVLNALAMPQSGNIEVDGIGLSEENRMEIRRRVALVFQNPDTQIVGDTVEEDVAFGPCNMGLDASEIRGRVDVCLSALGISDLRDRNPNMLSGGQKQLVAIAGALAMMPSCIVLDEATSMLDVRARKAVMDAVNSIRSEYGVSVVMITHRPEELAACDYIYVLEKGAVRLQGTPEELAGTEEPC